jgi:hypothetical protein
MNDDALRLTVDESSTRIRHSATAERQSIIAPPWDLRGSALVLPCRALRHIRHSAQLYKARLKPIHVLGRRLPGALALVHYEHSPVGTYDERAIAVLTWRGPSVVRMQVNSPASMAAGRANWGYPKTLAELSWQHNGRRVQFSTDSQTWRARIVGPAFPLKLRATSTQTLEGKVVRVPIRLKARVRLAFVGWRVGIFLDEFSLHIAAPKLRGASFHETDFSRHGHKLWRAVCRLRMRGLPFG